MKTKLLLYIISWLSVSTLFAQPGQLDPNFNISGIGAYGGTPPPAALNNTAQAIVYKSRVYQSGPHMNKIIIVGRFTSFNGVARKYIARLNADGTLDTSFVGPAFSTGYLYVTEVLSDGKVLVGGSFDVGGYKNFARLNVDGSLDTTFNPVSSGLKGADGVVHALKVLPDGKILVGGGFNNYNTISKSLVRLNANGNPDITYNGLGTPNGEIRAIDVQEDGKILAGGFFTGFRESASTTHPRNRILRLQPNGNFDSSFTANATGGTGVFDIKIVNGKIFVAGKFDKMNGVDKRGIACLLSDGSIDPDFNPGRKGVTNAESSAGDGAGYNIFSLCAQPDGKILIGGNFTQYNGENIPKGLARIYQDGSRDLSFVTGSGFTGGTLVYEGKSVVRDIVLQMDGKIVVGGDYDKYNGTSKRMLSRIITKDCDRSVQYTDENGWSDDILPENHDQLALIHSGVYTIPTGRHLVCCDLIINEDATLAVAPGASITVYGNIQNNGTFILEDDGSLIQTNEVATYTGSGIFVAKRSTTPMTRYDYTYWSSPVKNFTLLQLSPNTMYDKYFKFNSTNSTWQTILYGTSTMKAGEGYIVRAPQTYSLTSPSVYTAQFIGQPNNGNIKTTHTMAFSGENKWSLIGNPYPSAIDALEFVNDPSNTGIEGTIYLWTHNTPLTFDGQYYNYSQNDYATYNRTGFVAGGPYSSTSFDGQIASAQGFFVETNTNNTTVTFKNHMRRTGNNSQFFRSSQGAVTNSERSRIWLNLTSDQGAFSQTLIGYIPGATVGYDRSFDGRKFGGNVISLYTLEEEEFFTIQARPTPFDYRDVVALGFNAEAAGVLTITMNEVDGVFNNPSINVFLRDKYLGKTVNLKDKNYDFHTEAGTFNDRFEIYYTDKSANFQSVVASAFTGIRSNRESILVTSFDEQQIQSATVYDLTGKRLTVIEDVNNNLLAIDGISPRGTVLLVQVTLTNGEVQTKKVIH